MFDRGDQISVELMLPSVGTTRHRTSATSRKTVASGHGTFSRDDEVITFGPGDLLYVPAYVPHRFETFSDDFRAWVTFYGSKRTAPRGRDAA